jgi:tetratricopeptide (TPR) repeat protein
MAVKPRSAHVLCRLVVCAAVLAAASEVRGQLTVQDLTRSAVQGVGPYYQDVRDAIAAFAARDYKTALARLQNAKKVTPALAPAEIMMAQLYFDAGQPAGGIAMLETAAKSSPADPEAFVILAERALAEGRLTEAELLVPTIDKLAEAFNQNPVRRQNLRLRGYTVGAVVDQTRGRLADARARLEQVVKLDPKNAAAHDKLGQLLFKQNDQKGAYAEFQLAAEADKSALPAELMMANLFTDKLSREKWFEFALKKSGGDLRTQLAAANYRLGTNQVEQAKAHAEKAIELDPAGFESNVVVGLVARMEGDFAKAKKHLSVAHLLQPVNFVLMSQLGLVLMELPDDADRLRGLQFAELCVRENPDNADFLAALAWINYRLNRKAEAERFFGALFNSRQVQAGITSEMGFYLANLAKDRGNTQEAVKLLREALNTDKPFAYRKAAEQLLAELNKGTSGPAAAGSTQTGQQAK